MSVERPVPRYDGYIFDLDGTIYLGDRLLPHARKVILTLRERWAKVLFLSNKPLESRAAYAAKLTGLGIPARIEEVINSSLVMARHLTSLKTGATVYVIGEKPLLAELESAGLRVIHDPTLLLGDHGERSLTHAPHTHQAPKIEVDYVVVAMDRSLHYAQLNAALQALRQGAGLLATNPDPTCPQAGGEIPDTGAILAALSAASGVRPEAITGKPDPLMLNQALEYLGLPPERCLIAGDRLETDILMGIRAGMSTALLLTGVTTRQMLHGSDLRPDFVLEDLSGFLPERKTQQTEAL